MALRLRDVRRSGGARHPHRPPAVRGAPCAGRAARAEGHRLRRADAQPAPAVAAGRWAAGLSRQGDGRQAARSGAALPAGQRVRAGRHPRKLPPRRQGLARLRGPHGVAQPVRGSGGEPEIPHPARGGERPPRHLPAAGPRGEGLRRVHRPGPLFRRCRKRLRGGLHPLSRAVHADAAERGGEGAVLRRSDRGAQPLHPAHPRGAVGDGAEIQHQHHRRLAPDPDGRWRHPQRRLYLPARRFGSRAGEDPPHAQRGLLVEHSRRRFHPHHPDRLRPDRGADLLRLRVPGAGAAAGRRRGADHLRAVLHRQPAGLHAGALLRAGPGDREPVLRGHERQCRQPAQRRQHGHPICAKLHPDALRLPLRPRRDRGGGDRERRDADHHRRQPCRSRLGAGRRDGPQPGRPPLRSLPHRMG